ncbi:MAG: amidohydrolase family protein [Ardenticatenales bacterium]|nr:amidohydrolase family protein [Ardenticatenales bacterium]
MMTTLICAQKVLCLDEADTIYEPGYLLIEAGRLVEIGPGRPDRPVDEFIDLGPRLIMPGLVNAHTHTPMTLYRGLVEGRTLFDFDGWYDTVRVVEEVTDPAMVPAAVRVSCAEMIRTGTVCFADQYFWMDQIVPAVRQSGLRAALGYGVVELGEEAAREREVAAAAAFLNALRDDPLLRGWVGPHAFFVDNSEEAIYAELALADQFDTGLHIHLSTSGEEDRFCQDKYGKSAVEQMATMGILDFPLLAAHCLTVPTQDYPRLAAAPFTAAINPSSAMRNAAGVADVLGMQAAGISLALGTDNVTNNNSYDMFKEMQILGKLMALHHRTPNALPTRDILHMATLGGAAALGLADEIGSLEVGKSADWIALDLEEIGWAPAGAQDPYTALVYSVTGQHVRDVMVAGRWLYRDDRYQTLDYRADCAELERSYAELKRILGR